MQCSLYFFRNIHILFECFCDIRRESRTLASTVNIVNSPAPRTSHGLPVRRFHIVLTKVHVETDQISNNVLTVHTDRTDAETRECSTFNNGNIYIFITFFLAVSCNANRTTMKIAIVSLITLMASSASAFAPASFTRGVSTQIYSDPEEEDGDGFDLNLEEMFDM